MDEQGTTLTIDVSKMLEIGENILAGKTGDNIVLVINASKRLGMSASGKSTIVATTRGNVPFSGLTFGLNIYTKR